MYYFLVKTVTSFRVGGEVFRFQEVGSVVSLPDHIGAEVNKGHIPGTEHLNLQHIDSVPMQPVVTVTKEISLTSVEPEDGLTLTEIEPNSVSELKLVTEPVEPVSETVNDQPQSEPQPEPQSEPQSESQPQVEIVDELPDVHLPTNAHWSTVRSLVLKLEDEGDYSMIRAIKEKFKHYDVIQEEADRILAQDQA